MVDSRLTMTWPRQLLTTLEANDIAFVNGLNAVVPFKPPKDFAGRRHWDGKALRDLLSFHGIRISHEVEEGADHIVLVIYKQILVNL